MWSERNPLYFISPMPPPLKYTRAPIPKWTAVLFPVALRTFSSHVVSVPIRTRRGTLHASAVTNNHSVLCLEIAEGHRFNTRPELCSVSSRGRRRLRSAQKLLKLKSPHTFPTKLTSQAQTSLLLILAQRIRSLSLYLYSTFL